ncbi:co-chaperone GroES [Candidatus Borkfalkia ceftriaxoniphila]|jgi:chaperonin 10 Kd subunit|uniref:Co-chaperonin GroES n=1 Tax=Candidatus Borkfalkia ceftriaxoniphila TaxID=2508949 RepID=A0A4Q2K7K8_9FIRM|nr:co-chaperone GroES [Candidatus Borkfalkia ceftriaxoniphila]RXZ57914.1 co-chaperone GroES [Candidatus Borkfalkia ceftriaxoniphila]
MNIKPLFDRVVVESVQSEEKTKSGFILPSSAQEKPQTARVVAVGPGGVVDGKDVTMEVKIGDVVLYAKYSGSEFKVDGKEFTILRQSDILAIVE